jgi:hypothetical protein
MRDAARLRRSLAGADFRRGDDPSLAEFYLALSRLHISTGLSMRSAGFQRSIKVRRQWTEAAAVFSVHWQTVSTSAPVK